MSIEDTANTLKYANNAKRIKVPRNKNSVRKILSSAEYEAVINRLRKQIVELKNNTKNEVYGASNYSINDQSVLLKNVKIAEQAGKLEKAQDHIWKIRRKRLQLEIEGKCIRTQLEYWTKRKEVDF